MSPSAHCATTSDETRSLWRFPPFSWLLDWQTSKAHQHVLAELKATMEQTEKP